VELWLKGFLGLVAARVAPVALLVDCSETALGETSARVVQVTAKLWLWRASTAQAVVRVEPEHLDISPLVQTLVSLAVLVESTASPA
jgi:hypothetical protein